MSSDTSASNSSSNQDDIFDQSLAQLLLFHNISKYLTPVTIGCLLFVGLLGNAFVIYVTVTTQRIINHPVHSMLVLNLAVADLIYLSSSAPYQAIAHSVPEWIYGSFLCPALHYLNILTMAVSIFTMCSLAIMRFMALMMPFKVQRSFVTTSAKLTGCLVIGIVWFLAAILAVPNFIYFRLKPFTEEESNESLPLNTTSSWESAVHPMECQWISMGANTAYSIVLLVFTFIIPLVLVTVLYIFIEREILFFMRKNTPTVNNDKTKSEYVKTTIMVFCLIIAFLLCWFPYHLYATMLISQRYNERSYALMRSVLALQGHCFSYAHACVNPIIYTFTAPGFRRSLRDSFEKKQCGITRNCIRNRTIGYDYERGRSDAALLGNGTKLTPLTTTPTNNNHNIGGTNSDSNALRLLAVKDKLSSRDSMDFPVNNTIVIEFTPAKTTQC